MMRYIKSDTTILDCGAGSGILSIAAKKLGAFACFNYKVLKFEDEIKKATNGKACKNLSAPKTKTLSETIGTIGDTIKAEIERNI